MKPTLTSCRTPRLGRSGIAALVLSFALGAPGAAREEREPEPGISDGWRSSLWLGARAQQQGGKATLVSSLFTGPVRPGSSDGATADFRDDEEVFTAVVPTGLELMAPSVGFLPGRPRPFLEASYQWTPSARRDLLEEGKPSPVESPATLASLGLGGRVELESLHQWTASLGVAVPWSVSEQPIWLRPSVDYLGQAMRFESVVVGIPPGTNTAVAISSSDSEIFHSVGPRLGIEADAGRRGPLRFAVYVDFGAYWLLGEKEAGATDTVGGETATFAYELDDVSFQGGIGMRVTWDPLAEAIE